MTWDSTHGGCLIMYIYDNYASPLEGFATGTYNMAMFTLKLHALISTSQKLACTSCS
jgi:hypothetical protein